MRFDQTTLTRTALIGGAAVLVGLFGAHEARKAKPPARLGDIVPSLAVHDLNDRPVALALTGRTTVVNVFATWCSECRAEAGELHELQQAVTKRGATFVAIDQAESPAVVAPYAQAAGMPAVIDADNVTKRVLGVRFIPSTFVFGPDGRELAVYTGPLDPTAVAQLQTLAAASGTPQVSNR